MPHDITVRTYRTSDLDAILTIVGAAHLMNLIGKQLGLMLNLMNFSPRFYERQQRFLSYSW